MKRRSVRSDKSFEAQMDAQTLANAEEIKSSKTRMAAASRVAARMAAQKQVAAKNLKKIARAGKRKK